MNAMVPAGHGGGGSSAPQATDRVAVPGTAEHSMAVERFHPIGVPGQPWGEAERSRWRAQQRRQRSYAEDVLDAVGRLHAHWDMQAYGELDYAPDFYPLVAL